MNINNLREFLNDLFTLRTVWIDKGGGKWAVRKRLHPLLKSFFWTLALIVGAGVYSSLNNMPRSEAEAKPENNIVAAKLIEVDEPESAPPVNILQPQQIIIPLNKQGTKQAARTYKDYEILLSRDRNSNEGMIIKTPSVRKTPDVPQKKNNGKYNIKINKSEYTLSLFKGDELVKIYPIAVGKNPGDKQRVGDNRTPTGNFKIVSIENASTWSHNFRDGKGVIKGAYGPWFLRLDAKGWKGIGIHGTHDPNSLGTNATEGCIRLQNDDIAELKQYAYKNMPVSISEN